MTIEARVQTAFKKLVKGKPMPTVADIADAAGVSWPTAKRYLERLGLCEQYGLLPAETREKILAAAFDAFTQEGYAATSLNAIAERAGVSKGAIYGHFKSKDHLFAALIETHLEQDIEETQRDIADIIARRDNVLTGLTELLERQIERHNASAFSRMFLDFHSLAVHTEHGEVLMHLSQQLQERATEFIEDLKRRGLLRADVDASMLAFSWMLLLDGLTVRRAISGQKLDAKGIARGIGRILAHGVGA